MFSRQSSTRFALCHVSLCFGNDLIKHKISNIKHTKYQNLHVSRLILQFFLPIPLKSDVKSRMKMQLELRRQAMLHRHLSDQQFYCLLRCDIY